MGRPYSLTTKSGRLASYKNRLSERIKSSLIVDRLQKCVIGEIEMSSTQIQAARILLNKVLPDLKAVEVSDISPVDDIRNLSIDQALSLIDGSR